jgi:flagellar protein FliS
MRYLADAVSTATPARLIVMLYDRLGLDVRRAIVAQQRGDRLEASSQIAHAQQIIAELMSSLRPDVWSGAPDLFSLYGFLLGELIAVNAEPDVQRLSSVSEIVADLRESWHQAGLVAQQAAAEDAPTSPMAWVG